MNESNQQGEQTRAKADIDAVLALQRDLAAMLLDWSWEGTVGFEEALEKVGSAYGYDDTTAVVNSQSAAVQMAGRHMIAKCGIPDIPPLAAVPKVKQLFREIFSGKLTPTEAQKRVRAIKEAPPVYADALRILGVILLAVGFSVDVVGTWEGLWMAAVTGIPAAFCLLAAGRIKGFNKIAGFTGTALSGIVAMLAWKFGWVHAAPGLLLISATFVFIPGDSISVQSLELAAGRWGPAVDRLFYSAMVLVLQVSGAVLAAIVTLTALSELFPASPSTEFAWWAPYPARIIFTLGNMWAFQMRHKDYLPALVIVWITTAAAQLGTMAYGEFVGSFAGMLAATIASIWYAQDPDRSPAYVFLITPIFALSPGSHGLRALECWLTGNQITGVNNLATLAGVLLAIGLGMLLGAMMTHGWKTAWHKLAET